MTIPSDSTAGRVIAELERRGKVTQRGDQYRSNSPLRANSDSKSFSLTITDGEHGAWHDHVSGDKGSLYQLAEQLDIPLPTNASDKPVSLAYSTLEAYCGERHVQAFEAAGWYETTYDKRPALAYPTDTGTRYRFLDGNKPKYKSPQGYQACWYKLARAVELAQQTGQPLVICNGESSVVTAQFEGVAATCITGGENNAASHLERGLRADLQQQYTGDILIAFDCDPTGRKASAAVAQVLRKAGYRVRAVDLSAAAGYDGSKGYDLRDLCHLHQQDSPAIIAALPELDPPKPRGISAYDLLNKDFPPTRWAIEGVLPEGCFLLTGAPKMGKSWMLLDWSLAIASGGRAMGMIPVDQGDVLYVSLEGSLRQQQERIRQILQDEPPPRNLDIWTAADCPRADNGGMDAIEEWLQQHPNARLVGIDVLAAFRAPQKGRGNGYAEDYATMSEIKRLSDKYGVTVVVVHHNRKGTAESDIFEMVSGTQGLGAAADGYLLLQRSRTEADATLHITGRDVEEQQLALRFQHGLWTVLGDAERYQQTHAQRQILDILETTPDGLKPKAIADALGDKDSTRVRKLLQRMANTGKVYIDSKGNYICPSVTPVTPVTPVTSVTSVTSVTPLVTQSADVTPTCHACHGDPEQPIAMGNASVTPATSQMSRMSRSDVTLPAEPPPPTEAATPADALADLRQRATVLETKAAESFASAVATGAWRAAAHIIQHECANNRLSADDSVALGACLRRVAEMPPPPPAEEVPSPDPELELAREAWAEGDYGAVRIFADQMTDPVKRQEILDALDALENNRHILQT